MSDIFQALAAPTRRDIIRLLRARDMTAGQIADTLQVSKPTLSGHFNVLKASGLVISTRSGTTLTYSLNASVVEDLLSGVLDLVGHNKNEDEHKEAAQ